MRFGFAGWTLGVLAAGALLVSSLTADFARERPAAVPAPPRVPASPLELAHAGLEAAPRHPAPKRAAAAVAPERGKSGGRAQAPAEFTRFGVGERNVKRILVDGDRVWVATSGGLIRYTPSSDEHRLYDARSGLPSSEVVFLGKLGARIAAGTRAGGFSLLDASGERWEHHAIGGTRESAIVHDLLRASDGDVWLATGSGAWRVARGELGREEAWTRFTAAGTHGALPSDRVYGLAEGAAGEVWLATEGGIALHRRGEWSTWRSDFVVALATDPSGRVWAGTLGAGLARFDGRAWKRYTVDDGLPGNNVLALHRDAAGRLWIGTDRGLARMDDGAFRVLTRREGLYGDAVFAVASAPEALWVGSYGGVARLRGTP